MSETATDAQVSAAFEELGALENQFADVELDALRRKEHALTPLYAKRVGILTKIPNFWTQVFLNAPEEIQQLYSSADVTALAAIRNFKVERYQIKSETEGEPRSLRFTFEFDDNEHFGECTLVKEFEYRPAESGEGGPGDLISKAVPIKWKNKKSDLSKGMLDMAVELEKAEETMKIKKGGEEIELVEREGLWQYSKLREAVEKSQDAGDDPTFLNWFGFRGAVEKRSKSQDNGTNGMNGDAAEDGDDVDEWDDGMLDCDIFPAGESVAIALAEDVYPEAIDIWMQAQAEDDDSEDEDGPTFDEMEEDSEDGDDDAPELVEADDDAAEVKADDKRPSKRQRTE